MHVALTQPPNAIEFAERNPKVSRLMTTKSLDELARSSSVQKVKGRGRTYLAAPDWRGLRDSCQRSAKRKAAIR